MDRNKIYSKKRQNVLILLCSLLYICSYLGKYTFNASVTSIQNFYGADASQVGLIGSAFFFAYGAGQIINGVLCRFYNKKIVLSLSLIVSAIINVSIFLGIPFKFIKYIWFINGFALSTLWSSIVLVFSEGLEGENFSKANFAISFVTPIGTIITYMLTALFVAILDFRYAFLVGGIIIFIFGIIWFMLYDKYSLSKSQAEYLMKEGAISTTNQAENQASKPKNKIPLILLITLIFLGIFSMINAFMKDGLQTWAPNILTKVYQLDESISIILTLFLPLAGIPGGILAISLNKKIQNPILNCVLYFTLQVIVIALIILCISTSPYIIIILFACTALLSHGIAMLLTSILPLFYRSKINSGLLSGLLNGCGYLGSTIATYVLGLFQTMQMGYTSIFLIFYPFMKE